MAKPTAHPNAIPRLAPNRGLPTSHVTPISARPAAPISPFVTLDADPVESSAAALSSTQASSAPPYSLPMP